MKDPTFWKSHYVLATDPEEIENHLKLERFVSGAEDYELASFIESTEAPSILISQGSGGHSYVFAELGYMMHLQGYNVFIMPKQGGFTINELMERQLDAITHISSSFNDRIGVFGEGLGGFVTFYLALARGGIKSMALQNSPAILAERAFQNAVLGGGGPAQGTRSYLPILRITAKIIPRLKLPISSYLDWKKLVDPKEENRPVENLLVTEGYLKDPDFDRWYPLLAIMSLLSTPPPGPIEGLEVPTMFMIAKRGFGGGAYVSYLEELYTRLPLAHKRKVEVDGSVYWMLSHPMDATRMICDWFDETV